MGLFDDVSLSETVRNLVREQYLGHKEILSDGWQTKSLECEMETVVLADDHISTGGEPRPHFTGEVRFYRGAGTPRDPSWEWLEFIAVYVDGRIIAVRNIPETTI